MQIGIDKQDVLIAFKHAGIEPTPEKVKQLIRDVAEKNLLGEVGKEVISVLKNEIIKNEQVAFYAREGARRW